MGVAGGPSRVGLYGGSFDPIHVGHIALARAAQTAMDLTDMRWIPTGHAWQKSGQRTAPAHRVAMLRLALADMPDWQVDTIETDRDGPSYTIDTLVELRRNLGKEPALVLLMGSDQFHNLPTWHRYDELLKHTHIAVTQRERVRLHEFEPPVRALLDQYGADALGTEPAGRIVFFRMPAVPVSSTKLRAAIRDKEPVNDLLPDTVLDYIHQHKLYANEPDRH